MRLEAQHGGHAGKVFRNEVLAHDDDLDAGRAAVLLHAGMDEAVLAHVDRLGEEHRALVRHEHVTLGVRQRVDAIAIHGLVLADVDEGGVIANVEVGEIGNPREVIALAVDEQLGVTQDLGLLVSLLGPAARDDVIGLAIGGEVHEHRREEQRVATLQEEHLVVVRNGQQLAQIGLGLGDDLREGRRTMTHLHDGHAGALVIEHLARRLLQDLLGEYRRTGGEVVHACHDLTFLSSRCK